MTRTAWSSHRGRVGALFCSHYGARLLLGDNVVAVGERRGEIVGRETKVGSEKEEVGGRKGGITE